jgi:outer membrane protease
VITPSCLERAYKKLQAGAAWVFITFDDDGAWVYASGLKIEDVAEDIADMTYDQRMEYLVSGILEMEEHAEDVTP